MQTGELLKPGGLDLWRDGVADGEERTSGLTV